MTDKYPIRKGDLSNSRGMALLLCLLLLSILCLVGGAALGISGLNHRIVQNGAKQTQAFYMAEAGRQTALAFLAESPLWRGGGGTTGGSYDGVLSTEGGEGDFTVTLSDCTADDSGLFEELLPAGHILIESTGSWKDASQTLSCLVRMSPVEALAASFPMAAVVSSGPVTGALTVLDDLGEVDSGMIQNPAVLPTASTSALKAMAAAFFSALDDDAWDAALEEATSFWLDPLAETRPRILYVDGDLEISGDRQLYGIVLVTGEEVSFDGSAGIEGVLYAPNAREISVYNTGASGRLFAMGQLISGAGGVTISGNSVSVQHCREYVDAFNLVAGEQVAVDFVSGSWGAH